MYERRERPQVDWDQVFRDGTKIDEAVARGARQALQRHKALGQSIVVWRNGRPTWLKPEEIDIPAQQSTPETID